MTDSEYEYIERVRSIYQERGRIVYGSSGRDAIGQIFQMTDRNEPDEIKAMRFRVLSVASREDLIEQLGAMGYPNAKIPHSDRFFYFAEVAD